MAAVDVETLEDMLMQTAEKQITGSWQSVRGRGNWWLQRRYFCSSYRSLGDTSELLR